MNASIRDLQRDEILNALRKITRVDDVNDDGKRDDDHFKNLICDPHSKILLDNITIGDNVLNTDVLEVEKIKDSRQFQPATKGVYFLSALPHIVEWLIADLYRKRYVKAYVIWTSQLRPDLAARLVQSESGRQKITHQLTLNIDFLPKESHLITFTDPDSFQVLFNRNCDSLVKQNLNVLTRKVISICVLLGEYPIVRYYRPRNARHDAAVLCTHLAKFVQDGLDEHASRDRDFPPPSPRPRAVLLITDRSMDLAAPLVHELTYQAMAMDLVQLKEEDGKILYPKIIKQGQSEEDKEDKKIEEDPELNDLDKIWVENRHLHMKDLLVKLSDEFKKFQAKNSQFANNDDQNISVNTIKDMLAGLNEFQEGKDAFSLHIDMAEKCAKAFQDQKLLDVTSVEQSLSTGLDEDNNIPKNLADQLVRLLDDESVGMESRIRLLMLYILYRGGILYGDIEKLRQHGELPEIPYRKMIDNMDSLGARVWRKLSDPSVPFEPLYPSRKSDIIAGAEISLSRFEPMLRYALEEICQGGLDSNKFPPTKPHIDNPGQQANVQTSLRSASKPTWANTRPSANKPKQRIIVFIAGGATYSEARACYEISQQMNKDVILATTDMLTPKKFINQVSRLDEPRKSLGLSADKPPEEMPKWMQEPPPGAQRPHQPSASQYPPRQTPSNRPPVEAMQNMHLNPASQANGPSRPGSSQTSTPQTSSAGSFSTKLDHGISKLRKDKDKDKEKKHHHLGGLFRKH